MGNRVIIYPPQDVYTTTVRLFCPSLSVFVCVCVCVCVFHVPPFTSAQLELVHKFEFSSKFQRMSVVAQERDTGRLVTFVKGSPETIVQLCRPDTGPYIYLVIYY